MRKVMSFILIIAMITGCMFSLASAGSQTGPASSLMGTSAVQPGDEFNLTYGLVGVNDSIYAQQLSISYNSTLLEYKKTESIRSGVLIVSEIQEVTGVIKFILAETNGGLTGNADILRMTFKAKSTGGEAGVAVDNVLLGNAQGGEAAAAGCQKTISIALPTSSPSPNPSPNPTYTWGDGRSEGSTSPSVNDNKDKAKEDKKDDKSDNKRKTATVVLDKAPTVDKTSGIVQVTIDMAMITKVIEQAKADNKEDSKAEVKTIAIEIPKVEGAKAYEAVLPVALFMTNEKTDPKVELKTDVATLLVSPNMLKAEAAPVQAANVTLTIAEVDKADLMAETKAAIGDRPVVELNVKVDGKVISWSNPDAPVTVSIPYKPTESELKNPEHIVVFYIDGAGNAIPVPNGKYDPKTGQLTFTTTHFSKYAVSYVKKSFEDIASVPWAKKEIEVLASKGVINGTGDKTFTPVANITRADFLVLLVKSLALNTKVKSNFSDVKADDYYYEALGIAKQLGISDGKGNNLFDPKAQISRQEMMTLTARAMKLTGKLTVTGGAAELAAFSDKTDVAVYAKESIAALVRDGLVQGDGTSLNPLGYATRAEIAVLMYRIYNR